MNVQGYRTHLKEAKAKAAADDEMNKRMGEAVKIMDKLKIIMMEFAITMGPSVDKIAEFVQGIADFLSYGDGMILKITLISMSIGLLFKAFSPLATVTGGVIKMGQAIVAANATTTASTTAATASTTGFFASIKTGALAAGRGMSAFAAGVSKAMVAFANPATAFGSAIVMGLLLAVAAAAFGFAAVIKGFAELAKNIGGALASIKALGEVDLRNSLGGIGPALKEAQKDLENIEKSGGVKITSVLENMALISTGKSANSMAGGGMGGAMSNILGGISDSVASLVGMGKEGKSGMQMNIKLEGEAVKSLLSGEIVKAMVEVE